MTVSLQSSDSVVPLKAPFWLRRCARKKKKSSRKGDPQRQDRREATGSVLASRDVPCVGVGGGGGDGVGGRAEQTKMPGGWLNNTGFDE